MEVTLGGDRIGSGNKNKLYLHNYEMSTHDLSKRVTTTASPGILYPIYCIPAMRGDTFDININAQARTIPTRGPMFSTFKMQVDMYEVPMRLYQALLHNNPTKLGLNMSQVKLPKLEIVAAADTEGKPKYYNGEFANNCLLKYLGMSGIGTPASGILGTYKRRINAIPALGYYDIFKNYYANKQEDYAYQVEVDNVIKKHKYEIITIMDAEDVNYGIVQTSEGTQQYTFDNKLNHSAVTSQDPTDFSLYLTIDTNESNSTKKLEWCKENIILTFTDDMGNPMLGGTLGFLVNESYLNASFNSETLYISNGLAPLPTFTGIMLGWDNQKQVTENEMVLEKFKLSNIDDMRMDILSFHNLGESFVIKTDGSYMPYRALVLTDDDGVNYNHYPMNGLVTKTYQSDVFNNWLNAEWIEGENGIAEMTKIAVSDGSVYIDDLIMAKKTYELLNRVAVADGTYQAWLDVVYQESPNKHLETPMFIGGLSSEVVFEEIIQTTPTDSSALGTLGGRGLMVKRLGGQCYVKVDEPAFIMGILSLTPRIFYSQSNAFYMTELDSIDDLHKPAMDGIGFQDLIGETMCWTDTIIASDGTLTRTSVGKVPAWIMYQTAVDEVYGEFCDVDKQGYMVLNRNYNVDDNGVVQDFTTYIDPAKYNYVWADSSLLSQNFWVQVQFDVKARRKMSARQIPNL